MSKQTVMTAVIAVGAIIIVKIAAKKFAPSLSEYL